jgi:Helix-turn-helix domain
VSRHTKSRVAVWRDAVRDSHDLASTAKLVAWCLSTYMDGRGVAWPAQETLATGCSLSRRSVQKATDRLEQLGFLAIERSKGRSSHRYGATLPPTANEIRRSEWDKSERRAANREAHAPNSERPAHESAESVESGSGAAPMDAAAAVCHECETGGGQHVDGCSAAPGRSDA